MDYQHATHVAAEPDRLYAVLADPDNLVQFVPQVTAIHRGDGDTVEVEARYEGHTQRGEASLHTDETQRRVEWGTPGGSYHGSLAVDPDGDGSKLTLALSTAHDQDMDADVAGTLDAIRRLLEAQV
jgi:carbon monoxide dehydrogenase subunit G